MLDDVNTDTRPRYADWKAPADDGEHLIWPASPRLLQDTIDNGKLLASAHSVRLQNVPLPELRQRLRNWLGHADDAGPLIATGHQTELYHPGVWVKNALIHLVAERLGGQAYHVAVDTDEPKHLSLRWPGGTPQPLTDSPTAVSWSGLLDSPSPAHLTALERSVEHAAAGWDFQPVVARFLASLKRLSLEDEPKLAPAITNSLHALDWELGLRHHALLFSPTTWSEPYLVFVHHILARAGDFAADYNAALASYRRANKVKTSGRPMPDLSASDDECEVPFWLDVLSSGERFRASVVRMGDRWALRSPRSRDDIFLFDPAADGSDAAGKLLLWLRRNDLRLSPRALTLTMLLRLLVADQFVHGIGGGRYDQVTDELISRHFNLEPPRFAVTTATLYFPGAAGQTRTCMACILQQGHRLKHRLLGDEKHRLVEAIAAAPRRSIERSSLFSEMQGKLKAAAASRPPELLRWERLREEAEAREQEERVIFDRELFYAMQPADRLTMMIDRYRASLSRYAGRGQG
jgi:hypothetical protein